MMGRGKGGLSCSFFPVSLQRKEASAEERDTQAEERDTQA